MTPWSRLFGRPHTAQRDPANQLAEAEEAYEISEPLPYKPPRPSAPPIAAGVAADEPATGSPPGPVAGNHRPTSAILYDAAWLIGMTSPGNLLIAEIRERATHFRTTGD